MKYIWYIVAAIVVIGLVWWFMQTQNAEAPIEGENAEETAPEDAMENMDMEGMDMETEDENTGIPSAEETPAPADSDADVVIDLTGKPFEFSQTEIRVQQGDLVRINFTSTQGTHDWVVEEFNAATQQVTAGNSTSVEFVADQAGTFEYYCSVGEHRAMGMVGQLIVE